MGYLDVPAEILHKNNMFLTAASENVIHYLMSWHTKLNKISEALLKNAASASNLVWVIFLQHNLDKISECIIRAKLLLFINTGRFTQYDNSALQSFYLITITATGGGNLFVIW